VVVLRIGRSCFSRALSSPLLPSPSSWIEKKL
jgi:hypothetical protein